MDCPLFSANLIGSGNGADPTDINSVPGNSTFINRECKTKLNLLQRATPRASRVQIPKGKPPRRESYEPGLIQYHRKSVLRTAYSHCGYRYHCTYNSPCARYLGAPKSGYQWSTASRVHAYYNPPLFCCCYGGWLCTCKLYTNGLGN